MLSFLLSRLAVVFVAFVAAAASIIALLFIVFPRSAFEEKPSDFLPRDSTLAYFEFLDDRNAWIELVPDLRNLPAFAEGTSIALIRSPDVAGWVSFARTSTDQNGRRVGLFTISTSSPELLALITRRADRLSNLPILRQSNAKLQGAAQFYLRTDILPSPRSLGDDLFHALMKDAQSIALHTSASGSVLLWESDASNSETFSPWIEKTSDGTSLTLQNAEQAWMNIIKTLEPATAHIVSSLAETAVREHFGKDISWTFDVLPLLQQRVTLTRKNTQSGSLFLIRGMHNASKELQTTLEKMHTSVEAALPKSAIEKNIFDARFSSERLLSNTSKIVKKTGKVNGWDVQDTTLTNGRGLVTALRGKDFLVSNDAAWIREPLKETSPTLRKLPSQGTSILAGGQTDAKAVHDRFKDSPLLHTLLPSNGEFHWSLEQRGNLMMLRWANR